MTADLFPEIPHRCSADRKLVADLKRDGCATFTCARCGLEVCSACQGAADDHPDLCNACWVAVETPSSSSPTDVSLQP